MTSRRTGATVLAVLVVLAVGAAASVAYAATTSERKGANTTVQPQGRTVAPRGTVKPLIVGFIDKGSAVPYQTGTPFPATDTDELSGYQSAFAGIVVNVAWSQLEPSEGQFDLTPLARSLDAVASYNTREPSHPLGVKLRIWAGFAAPDWAKSLGGSPITVAAGSTGASGTLGRFWSPDYEQQWTELQDHLAAAYDTDPLVREVAVTSCSTATGEPFVLTSNVIGSLVTAGWTTDDEHQCLASALADYAAWHHTAVDYTFNTLSDVSSDGTRTADPDFTRSVMTACARSGPTGTGPECILDNHGLGDTVTPRQEPVYSEMVTLWQQFGHHVPTEFQTDSPDGFDLCRAVGVAVDEHGGSIEVWPAGAGFAGFSTYPPAQLTAWEAALVEGRQPSC